jgi:hypothetical protein
LIMGHIRLITQKSFVAYYLFSQKELDMSHVVTLKAEVRCEAAIRAACQRRALPMPIRGTHKLFSADVTGMGVRFPGWIYPAVCETVSGQVHCDTFGGRWGDPVHLDRFLQAYAVERASAEARKQGHSCSETMLNDGSIKLTIHVNGGASQ